MMYPMAELMVYDRHGYLKPLNINSRGISPTMKAVPGISGTFTAYSFQEKYCRARTKIIDC